MSADEPSRDPDVARLFAPVAVEATFDGVLAEATDILGQLDDPVDAELWGSDLIGALGSSAAGQASLTLPGATHTPFVSLGGAAAEHGVTLASASKAFNVAGLKGAIAVAGSASMQRLLDRLPASCQYGAGLFGVLASMAAWDSGGEWLDALVAQLDHARTEFGRLLGERLPQARYVPPEASYLAWVDCARLGLGPEPAQAFLDRGRVALGRGLNFGAPGDGFVRVTIGNSSALLADIVDRMATAVDGAVG